MLFHVSPPKGQVFGNKTGWVSQNPFPWVDCSQECSVTVGVSCLFTWVPEHSLLFSCGLNVREDVQTREWSQNSETDTKN